MKRIVFFVILAVLFSVEGSALYGQRQEMHQISFPTDDFNAGNGIVQHRGHLSGVDFSQATLNNVGNRVNQPQQQNHISHPSDDFTAQNGLSQNHRLSTGVDFSQETLKTEGNKKDKPQHQNIDDVSPTHDVSITQHGMTVAWPTNGDVQPRNPVLDNHFKLSQPGQSLMQLKNTPNYVLVPRDYVLNPGADLNPNFDFKVRSLVDPAQHSPTKQNVVSAVQDSSTQQKDISSSNFQDHVMGQQHRLSLSPFLNQHASTKQKVVHAVQDSPAQQKDISSSNFQDNVMNQKHRLTLSPYLNQQNLKLEAPLPVNNFKSSKSDSNFQQTNPEPLMVQEPNPEFLPMSNQHNFQLNAPVELHNLKDILPSQDEGMQMVVDDTWPNQIGKPTATSFKENNVFNDKLSRFNGLRVLIAEQNKGSKFHPRQQPRGRKTVHKKRQAVRKVKLASHRETIDFAKLAPTLSSGRAFQSRSGNALHEKAFSPTTNTRIALASNRHVEGSQFAKNRVPSVTVNTFGEEPIPAMQNRGFFPQQALAATTNTREISRKRLPPMSEIFGGASLFKPRPNVIKFFHMNPKTQDLLSFRG